MRLKHITFTGIDSRTDIFELEELQQQYPFVEWGVLLSKNWRDNGNRYFNPRLLSAFKFCNLRLSAHLCGTLARAAVRNDWQRVYHMTGPFIDVFRRCQLNIANRPDNPKGYCQVRVPFMLDEVIIQQKSADDCDFWNKGIEDENVTVLLDASGGQGIDTPIKTLHTAYKVGYAGGINEYNVEEKLSYLLTDNNIGDFWIDMESGVRTDDWFDISKVRRVLEVCQGVIDKYGAVDKQTKVVSKATIQDADRYKQYPCFEAGV